MDTSNEQNNKEQNEKNNNVNNDEEKDMDEDSSSIESIFKDDPPKNEEEDKKEEKEEKSDTNILNIFMGKKKKKELTPEQKEERIKKSIERYCKRNDRMLELMEKVNKGEATNRNIKEMMRLLAIDLSDTKKLINKLFPLLGLFMFNFSNEFLKVLFDVSSFTIKLGVLESLLLITLFGFLIA